MDNVERVRSALKVTRAMGLPDREVLDVLKQLWNVFDENWDIIEAEDYRALLDAYFEKKETKRVEEVKKSVREDDENERPFKRTKLHGQKDHASSAKANQSQILTTKDGDGLSVAPPGHRIRNSSQLISANKGKHLHPLRISGQNVASEKKVLEPSGKRTAVCGQKKSFLQLSDIAKGSENVKIPLTGGFGNEELPKFTYMPHNIIYQKAYVQISLARISDEDCCSTCAGDCLSCPIPCACARETGGEFAYTREGSLKEKFLAACIEMKNSPQKHHFIYCQDCPLERSKNEYQPDDCKGHLIRKFIKECWTKCGCNMECGNRVVQRGITCNLQVFSTCEGKGWGVRTLQELPKGTFVCEYVGEILTNTELYERNIENSGCDRHTYPVTLDADWGSERILKDEEALCLDATFSGNVARFINHRCCDANLIDIPVEVETPDRHYYHLAFFTTRQVNALEELSWDYGIDFDDHDHPIKAFKCSCGSTWCRDVKQKGTSES